MASKNKKNTKKIKEEFCAEVIESVDLNEVENATEEINNESDDQNEQNNSEPSDENEQGKLEGDDKKEDAIELSKDVELKEDEVVVDCKVNMFCPSGRRLVVGEKVVILKSDLEHIMKDCRQVRKQKLIKE